MKNQRQMYALCDSKGNLFVTDPSSEFDLGYSASDSHEEISIYFDPDVAERAAKYFAPRRKLTVVPVDILPALKTITAPPKRKKAR